MASSIQHPSSLNPWQQYRQARFILRNTSRASNPAWYQDALELDLQLHIRPDGPLVFSGYYDRKNNKWTPGPELSEDILHDETKLEPVIKGILAHSHKNHFSSIGVILHVADEFATTELKPELDNPATLPDLRNTVVHEPAAVVEDSSIDADIAAWRILPYDATGSEVIGTTITITKQYAPFLSVLRKAGERENFPIITHALSAPLVALMGLPQTLRNKPQKPFVTILQYPWFTVMAFFNEHADLRLIRTLHHQGSVRSANLRNALYTTSTSLEFLDPDLFIIPFGLDVDESLEQNLQANFSNSRVEVLQPPISEGVPEWCCEPVIATLEPTGDETISSQTLTSLRADGWALQNFSPTSRNVVEVYPNKAEMAMLRMGRLARTGLVLITLAGLGYFGLGSLQIMQREEWSFDSNQANLANAQVNQLNAELKRIEHWDNLLEDRSKAWVVMESFTRMFPDNGSMLISDLSYSAKPEKSIGTAQVGYVCSWKVTGFARGQALEYLNKLNSRDGIEAHFKMIAETTGMESYDPALGNRSLTVNIRTRENRRFKPPAYGESDIADTTAYPFSFDLSIIQRYESTDPMAININKAP